MTASWMPRQRTRWAKSPKSLSKARPASHLQKHSTGPHGSFTAGPGAGAESSAGGSSPGSAWPAGAGAPPGGCTGPHRAG
eukprot:6624858-Heterocapsa_arctica.AAC.1